MKNFLALFTLMSIITLTFSDCKKLPICDCETWENCIGGNCVVKDNVYFLGETGIELEGEHFYVGVMRGEVCPDTVVVDLIEEYYMRLYVKLPRNDNTYRIDDMSPALRRSEEFAIDSIYGGSIRGHLCNAYGGGIDYRVYPDSIGMIFYLRPIDGSSDVRKNYATLYKQ